VGRDLAESGFEIAFARVRRLIGMGGDRLIEELIGLARDRARSAAIGARRSVCFASAG
jgi:hypothetical protein